MPHFTPPSSVPASGGYNQNSNNLGYDPNPTSVPYDPNASGAYTTAPVIKEDNYHPVEFDNESINPVRNTIKDHADSFETLTCHKCGYGKIELILPDCRHPYHLVCFNQFCITCNSQVRLEALDLKDSNTCSECQDKENLLKCQHCLKLHCFMCIHMKTLQGCCQYLSNNLENESTQCPGCEYTKPYSKFIPFKCKGHSLLCKKCLILGFNLKKCVLGCDLSLSLNEFIDCSTCRKKEPAYLGEARCPEGCAVCDTCQWVQNLKNSEHFKLECASCAHPLVY
jgi:hypothetical protein